jgi:spore coat polysaccharide biosynthesis protein SpsF
MNYRTDQESFWAGKFGSDYSQRNAGAKLLASNLAFFSKALASAAPVDSCIEFGANIGLNLEALRQLFPDIELSAIEINADAVLALTRVVPALAIHHQSILEFNPSRQFDVVLIKGVLIHMDPEVLPAVYDRLYRCASRYILLAEYYNPNPISIPYRGHSDRLFKRDFAGELLDRYPDLSLRDYGFAYRRDPKFPQDDITWFLLEKLVQE